MMSRIRGLSNENYRERKAALDRILRDLFDGYAADPIPQHISDALYRAARHDA